MMATTQPGAPQITIGFKAVLSRISLQ